MRSLGTGKGQIAGYSGASLSYTLHACGSRVRIFVAFLLGYNTNCAHPVFRPALGLVLHFRTSTELPWSLVRSTHIYIYILHKRNPSGGGFPQYVWPSNTYLHVPTCTPAWRARSARLHSTLLGISAVIPHTPPSKGIVRT